MICGFDLNSTNLGAVQSSCANTNIYRLLYVEPYETAIEAIRREKQLKKWNRNWKIQLIEKDNLEWRDLSDLII